MVWVAEGWGKERRRKPRDKRHMAAMVVPLIHWSVRLHGSHHPLNCVTPSSVRCSSNVRGLGHVASASRVSGRSATHTKKKKKEKKRKRK